MANIYDIELLNSIMNPKTPRLGLEPLYPNFGAPMPMEESDIAPEYGLNLIGNDLPYLKELTPMTDMGATGITPQLAQGIMQQASGFPLYDDMNPIIDTSYGVANEPDVEEEVEETSNEGLSGLLKTILGFAIPGSSLFMGGMDGIKSLNSKLQNSNFGQSKNLMDYLDMMKYGGAQGRRDAAARNMAQARGIQKGIDRGDFDGSGREDRDRDSVTEESAGESKGVGGGGYTESDDVREGYRG